MSHFQGKDALSHVREKKLEGSLSEPHGLELPGLDFAVIDSARQLSSLLLFLLALFLGADLAFVLSGKLFLVAGSAFTIVFAARSALLGWTRLERLHRIAEQERYEIEHHRLQERAELKALYSSKGFKGDLLEKVVDVLMADDNRLLKVMLEEEMGLSLESYDHPLKPAFASFATGLIILGCFAVTYFFLSWQASGILLLSIIAGTSLYSAFKEKNHMITSLVWNVGAALLATLFAYFAIDAIEGKSSSLVVSSHQTLLSPLKQPLNAPVAAYPPLRSRLSQAPLSEKS